MATHMDEGRGHSVIESARRLSKESDGSSVAKRRESALGSAREFVRKRLPQGFSSRDFNPAGIFVRLLLSDSSELFSRYSISYHTESMSISSRKGSASQRF
jgi:hypothetical protein